MNRCAVVLAAVLLSASSNFGEIRREEPRPLSVGSTPAAVEVKKGTSKRRPSWPGFGRSSKIGRPIPAPFQILHLHCSTPPLVNRAVTFEMIPGW